MSVQLFNSINVEMPKKKIYYRLGYTEGKTEVKEADNQRIEEYINCALGLIELKGSALELNIENIEEPKVILSNSISFKSRSLASFLSGCRGLILMAATAGEAIVKETSSYSEGKDITAAVIFDAVASEMADAALNWIMNYFNVQLRRENKQLTKGRFSCGYSDFGLENQKIIYETLKLRDIGIKLSENYILIPEKSVTALAGISIVVPGQ